MKAMILAAGLGTRLKPLTDDRPKALVQLHGLTLLELVIRRLIHFSFNEIIVNVHHFADQVVDFLEQKNNFGIHIEISREPELLDTGGGLKKAEWFFDDGQPFLVHNVDVLSDLDYNKMIEAHIVKSALATLAVRQRKTSRYFLFDPDLQLCGWQSLQSGETKICRDTGSPLQKYSFMGIHVLSPQIFNFIDESGCFSIVPAYLDLASAGQPVFAFPADSYRWLDLGKKEQLDQASTLFSDMLP